MAVAEPSAAGWRERFLINREFSWLWIAQVISACGDWVGFFAITALAASISGSPEAATALVLTARVAPSFFLAPFMGVLVDRFDRRILMRVADCARAVVFMTLPFVRSLWGLIVASLILEAFTLMWSPAKESLVPSLVPKPRLTNANSLSLLAAYATMPLAGVLQYFLEKGNQVLAGVSWLEPLQFGRAIGHTQALAFYFDAATFLITALIVWRCIHTSGVPRHTGAVPVVEAGAEEPGGFRKAIDDIRVGWRYIFVNPVVRAVNLGLAAGLLGGAMIVPLGPTFAKKVTGDVNTFSLYLTALGLGVAIAVAVLNIYQERLPKARVFVAMLFIAGVSLAFGVTFSQFWLSAVGVFGLGLGAGSVYVLGFTLLQENTDDELRGRIFSTLMTLVRLCVLGAMVLGPAISALIEPVAKAAFGADAAGIPVVDIFGKDYAVPGVRWTLWIASAVIVVASTIAARALRIGFRDNLRGLSGGLRTRSMSGEPEEFGIDPGFGHGPASARMQE